MSLKCYSCLESAPSSLVRDLVGEIRTLIAEDHSPFQNRSKLGPGPRGDRLVQVGRWNCSGSNYEQTCVGIAEGNQGRVIRIKIDPEYKSRYNREYKKFIRDKKRKAR